MGKKEKRNYEDMDCLEVNLNVKAVIVYQVSSQKMAIDCNLYLRCEQKF